MARNSGVSKIPTTCFLLLQLVAAAGFSVIAIYELINHPLMTFSTHFFVYFGVFLFTIMASFTTFTFYKSQETNHGNDEDKLARMNYPKYFHLYGSFFAISMFAYFVCFLCWACLVGKFGIGYKIQYTGGVPDTKTVHDAIIMRSIKHLLVAVLLLITYYTLNFVCIFLTPNPYELRNLAELKQEFNGDYKTIVSYPSHEPTDYFHPGSARYRASNGRFEKS